MNIFLNQKKVIFKEEFIEGENIMYNLLSYFYERLGDGKSYFYLCFDSSDNMVEIRMYDGSGDNHKKIVLYKSDGSYGAVNYTIKYGPQEDWTP